MVSLNSTPEPDSDPQARRQLAEKLAEAAMIMGGFGPSEETPPAPRFSLGKTYATAAVTRWTEENEIDLAEYLIRHHHGDWGDLDEEDKAANENALGNGSRIFSCYVLEGRKIYLITEADRSMTTVLFASEY